MRYYLKGSSLSLVNLNNLNSLIKRYGGLDVKDHSLSLECENSLNSKTVSYICDDINEAKKVKRKVEDYYNNYLFKDAVYLIHFMVHECRNAKKGITIG